MSTNVLNICEVEGAKKFYIDHFSYPKSTVLNNRWFSWLLGNENVVFSNSASWTKQRHVINPAFYRIEAFESIFAAKTAQCIDKIEKLIKESEEIMAFDVLQRLTLDVLSLSVFGYDFNYLVSDNDETLAAYNFAFSNLIPSVFHLALPFLNYMPTPKVNQLVDALTKVDGTCYKLIKISQSRTEKSDKTLLDMMVDSNSSERDETKRLDDEELRNNIAVYVCTMLITLV